ncbi:MAG: phosphoribosylanthranilate isomerase [Chloroflexota bacterium]
MTMVKICGLSRVEDAQAAIDAGADFLGFVFAPARRQVTPRVARDLICALSGRSGVKTVGVFVDEQPARMNELADFCDLDLIQLGAGEILRAGRLERPIMRVVDVEPSADSEVLAARIDAISDEYVVLDTASPGVGGGTGKTFNWSLVPELRRPAFLAGGLDATNVASAIGAVHPAGVDVSSGVETAGHKDQRKIREFIRAVRAADAERI